MTEDQLYQRLASEVRRPIIRRKHIVIGILGLSAWGCIVVWAAVWIEKVLP